MENNRIDLSRFDGHAKDFVAAIRINQDGVMTCSIGQWSSQGYCKMWVRVAPVEEQSEVTATQRLFQAAPDLLVALKESRKENDELREKVRVLQEFYDIAQGVMGMVERTLDGSITSTEWPFRDQDSLHIPEGKI